MTNLIYLSLIVLSFFFPWISLGIILLGILYLIWQYFSSTILTSKILNKHKYVIIQYFDNKIGNGEFHFKYISKYSLYFLHPESSKVFGGILFKSAILLVVINIVFFFKFDHNPYIFHIISIAFLVISLRISQDFERPLLDYQNRERDHIFNTPLFIGSEEYPHFFYYGEWDKINNSF